MTQRKSNLATKGERPSLELIPRLGWALPPLPVPLTPMQGRERECAELLAMLERDDVRLIVLTGPGGIGKTRLALAVAEDAKSRFRHGVGFVALSMISDPALVATAIAAGLSISEEADRSAIESIVAALSNRHIMLVIDNFEQVVSAAPVLTAILSRTTGVKILVTSRSRLGITGEHLYAVGSLPIPADADLDVVTQVETNAAVRLFTQATAAVRPGFRLTQETAANVVGICRRLEGWPLAIELAAARSAALPLSALLQRLSPRLPLLAGGPRDTETRMQTMRSAIDWSYQLLTAHEQDVFVQLSVFSGGFTLAAAEAVFGTTPDISVFDAIESLVNKSLLRLETDDLDEPRYTMLETIREFGTEILVGRGDEKTVRDRHGLYFCQLADDGSLHLKTSETAVWLPRLNAARDNLRATLEWLDRSDQADAFLKCASWMATYWDYQGQLNEGRLWIERALSRPDICESSAFASCLVWLGWFQLRQGELTGAEASLRLTVPIWTRLGHVSGLAYAHMLLGTIARTRAEFVQAREHVDEALRLFTSVNDVSGMSETLVNCSKLDYETGDLRGALANAEAGLASAAHARIITYTAVASVAVAQARTATGDLVGALAAVRHGFEVAQSINFVVCCADATAGAAAIAVASGQRDLAARLLGAAEEWLKRTGSARFFFHHQFEKTRDQTRAALGAQRFDRLIAEGALFSPEAITETVASLAIETIAVRSESPQLTSREREVLMLLAAGKSDREIADALFITYRTANAYVARVLTKLDVPSRTAAASRALREGLI